MGLMDKVKGQANQLAQKTQETAHEGKAKLDQAQANRRADALLRQLGTAVYAQRTGRGTADSQAKIDKLINDISGQERESGLNLTDQPQPTVPQPGSPPDPDTSASSLQPAGSAPGMRDARPRRRPGPAGRLQLSRRRADDAASASRLSYHCAAVGPWQSASSVLSPCRPTWTPRSPTLMTGPPARSGPVRTRLGSPDYPLRKFVITGATRAGLSTRTR
jgi:hypothetical protein